MKILVDENIPQQSVELEDHDVKYVREASLGAEDKDIVEIAKEEERAIITQDSDFGEIYYFSNHEIIIVIIQPVKQSVEKISDLITNSVKQVKNEEKGLFQISKNKTRVRK